MVVTDVHASLGAHGVLTLVVFAVVSLLCIAPLRLPLPGLLSRWLRAKWAAAERLLGFHEDATELAGAAPALEPPKPLHIPLTHVTAPVVGVLFLLATVSITGKQVRDGIAGEGDIYPYDVLVFFLSLAYITISLDATGLLRYLACHVCQKAAFDGRLLYVVLYAFLWVVGVVLGNDPMVLSGTPFLVYLTRMAGIVPSDAWIWAQFVVANVASAVLVSSNLTNLVVATGFNVSFAKYTAYMALPSLASAIAALGAIMLFFSVTRPKCDARDARAGATDASMEASKAESSTESSTESLAESTAASATADTATSTATSGARAPAGLRAREASAAGTEDVCCGPGDPRPAPAFISRHIPSPDIAPRSLLVDPVGAVFCSVIMLAVIGTVIGVSAVREVRVFQIGVPGAALCALRDLVLDLRGAWRRRKHGAVYCPEPCPGWRRIGCACRGVQHTVPSLLAAARRLPVSLLPFAFGMFILVQALGHVGFVTIMGRGVARVCEHGVAATVFFMALLSIVLCNVGGTNIGATILLTRMMQSAAFQNALGPAAGTSITKAGMYATALGSNLGALGGTFAASLAGLLWNGILRQHHVKVTPLRFAIWCLVTVVPAACAGLGVLLAEVQYFGGAIAEQSR